MDQQNMEKFNKIINTTSFIVSSLCVLTSVADNDWTEALAWGIITLYNLRDLFYNSSTK